MIEALKQRLGGAMLRIILAGAGINLARIATIPGASAVLDGIIIPYSEVALTDFLQEYLDKSVSIEAIQKMLDAGIDNSNSCTVTITGALTTNRYRKGMNHAYIGISQSGIKRYWHILLEKLSEEEYNKQSSMQIAARREQEDIIISNATVGLLLGTSIDQMLLEYPMIKEFTNADTTAVQ